MVSLAPRRHIVLLGGTGFIGRELVDSLLKQKNQDDPISLINRGHVYWKRHFQDFEKWKTVKSFQSDRKDKQHYEETLTFVLKLHPNHFIVVIDFCAYKRSEVKVVTRSLLPYPLHHYIFISSDSIYDVCLPFESTSIPPHRIPESADVRPMCPLKQQQLRHQDKYGDNKLRCEEFLRRQLRKNKLKFTCLRLCDVIGAFDTTDRFWSTYLMVVHSRQFPFVFHEDMKKPLSFTYSLDVVQVIECILYGEGVNVDGLSLNVAMEETTTLWDLLNQISYIVHGKPILFENGIKTETYYPSVNCGPVQVERVRKHLQGAGYIPTSMNADTLFPEHFKDAVANLPKNIRRSLQK